MQGFAPCPLGHTEPGCRCRSLQQSAHSPAISDDRLSALWGLVPFLMHLFLRFPLKSCRPTRAKTLKQKTVRMVTSASFLTEWIRAPTMTFSPVGRRQTCSHTVKCHPGAQVRTGYAQVWPSHTPGSFRPSFSSASCICPQRQVDGACRPHYRASQPRPGRHIFLSSQDKSMIDTHDSTKTPCWGAGHSGQALA